MKIIGRVVNVNMNPLGYDQNLALLTVGTDPGSSNRDRANVEICVFKESIPDEVTQSSRDRAVAISMNVTLNSISIAGDYRTSLGYGGADIKVIDEQTACDLGLPGTSAWANS